MTHALPVVVAALYRFASFDDHAALRAPLEAVCREAGIKGTLLLAPEGINGTIAGTRDGVDRVLAHIRALSGCAALDVQESGAAEMPFFRMQVRLKRAIVPMGVPGIDPARDAGAYVDPEHWTELLRAPDVVGIDHRKD